VPLYPLGISRRQDLQRVPAIAAGSTDVRWSMSGDLACAYVDQPRNAVEPAHHAAAVEAIHCHICVLPVRFGTNLNDEAELRFMLGDRGPEMLDQLGSLDGCCEMGLRIGFSEAPAASIPPEPTSASPSQYLELRRIRYRQADDRAERERAVVQQFVKQVDGCYRQWRKLPSSPARAVRLAFLVARDGLSAFQRRFEGACATYKEGPCSILGPWPPYSFV
jgi:hypothetical protein